VSLEVKSPETKRECENEVTRRHPPPGGVCTHKRPAITTKGGEKLISFRRDCQGNPRSAVRDKKPGGGGVFLGRFRRGEAT